MEAGSGQVEMEVREGELGRVQSREVVRENKYCFLIQFDITLQ